jgi:hypothetical protein
MRTWYSINSIDVKTHVTAKNKTKIENIPAILMFLFQFVEQITVREFVQYVVQTFFTAVIIKPNRAEIKDWEVTSKIIIASRIRLIAKCSYNYLTANMVHKIFG